MSAKLYTTADVAAEFGITPRALRVFLRSENGMNGTVGKGHRWTITGKDMQGLRKRYNAYSASNVKAEKATENVDVVDVVDDVTNA